MPFGFFGDMVHSAVVTSQEVVPIAEVVLNQTARVLRGKSVAESIYITLSAVDKRNPGSVAKATEIMEGSSKILNSLIKTTPEATPLRTQTIKTLDAFEKLNREYRQFLNNKGLFRFIDGMQARSALKKFNREFNTLLTQAGLPVTMIPGL
ncbi:MAG: hypothetical protein QNJ63_08745 [Calothrix sp. MO_192.B10]|nr:hypothetical protein [Calothrix sp. MO_192.B10]